MECFSSFTSAATDTLAKVVYMVANDIDDDDTVLIPYMSGSTFCHLWNCFLESDCLYVCITGWEQLILCKENGFKHTRTMQMVITIFKLISSLPNFCCSQSYRTFVPLANITKTKTSRKHACISHFQLPVWNCFRSVKNSWHNTTRNK